MNIELTTQEKLKDLRVERGLTLEELAEKTGLSKSALGKYEADDPKDISLFAITTLARFYGVTTDYLLCLTDNKNPANAELSALHLRDEAIDSIRDGKYNKRLLSEILTHEQFRQLMIDAEIYVDRIVDGRINDMNVMLEATRKQAMEKYNADSDDLYMRTLELGQIQTDAYFAHTLTEDLSVILKDIREAHVRDATTADEDSSAKEVEAKLQEAMSFKGSPQEKQARVYLSSLGIDYDAITKEEFVTLIGILQKSKNLQTNQGSQRGRHSHGKKRK